MTGMSSLFTSYSVCSSKDKVRKADGSLSPVVGQGNSPVIPNIRLSSSLHVPKFSLNLLSINHTITSLKVLIVALLFIPLFVCFRIWCRGRLLVQGMRRMVFIY